MTGRATAHDKMRSVGRQGSETRVASRLGNLSSARKGLNLRWSGAGSAVRPSRFQNPPSPPLHPPLTPLDSAVRLWLPSRSRGACKSQPTPLLKRGAQGEKPMDQHEMTRWHDRREALFSTRLPHSAISIINRQLPQLDAERAERALVSYAAQKPYKGFYMLRYMIHYERVGDGKRDSPSSGTDRAPKRPSDPAANAPGDDQIHAQRREREAYGHLPPEFLRECRTKYADWGWPEGSRGWMILCLDAYVGRDVECYRIYPAFGSAEYDRTLKRKAAAEAYERDGMQTAVERLRAKVLELGGTIDAIA